MSQNSSQDRADCRWRVCVVTAGGDHPAIIINALSDAFGPIDVIMERPESKKDFLARRARKLGWFRVLGQFLTMALIVVMKWLQSAQIEESISKRGLAVRLTGRDRTHHVQSANSLELLQTLERLKPDVVLLCGCRMLGRTILTGIDRPLVNYHAGITPKYRGMNGGYWALVVAGPQEFGATLHFVDQGVDTGGIIDQVKGPPARDDTIWTYAYTQAEMSREMCVAGLRRVLDGTASIRAGLYPSDQHYHPELWRYVWTGVSRGIW